VKIFASRQVLTRAGISQADIDRLKKSLPRGHPLPDADRGQGGSGDDDGDAPERIQPGRANRSGSSAPAHTAEARPPLPREAGFLRRRYVRCCS